MKLMPLILLIPFVAVAEEPVLPGEVAIFQDAPVCFDPADSAKIGDHRYGVEENGRVAVTEVQLPEWECPHRIFALLTLKPVPKDEMSVHDRWDRAGNIRLRTAGGSDIELVRFITSYGGRTEHEVEVTPLAPLLRGRCDFAVFIDTWVNPAWEVDLTLRYEPMEEFDNASWGAPLFYDNSYDRERFPDGREVEIEIPEGLSRAVLYYYSTGHCTDGTDEDEFVSKANVISVDGVVVERFHPWRDDCRRFRDRNPYTRRWSDGTWSSDYSRSGWCPGVEVLPREIDLTDHLRAGRHTFHIQVEDVRAKDENDHYGYWRLSAFIAGWADSPRLWRNY